MTRGLKETESMSNSSGAIDGWGVEEGEYGCERDKEDCVGK